MEVEMRDQVEEATRTLYDIIRELVTATVESSAEPRPRPLGIDECDRRRIAQAFEALAESLSSRPT